MESNKKNFKSRILYLFLSIVVLGLSFILSNANIQNFNWNCIFARSGIVDSTNNNRRANMSVHFLDVGKADCAYIKCGDKNILIDAADKETSNSVVEYLKRQRVKKLDMVFVSHPHRDHIGQMESVINEFKIDKFIESEIPENIISTTRTYEKMLNALNNKKVKVKIAKPGEKFELGDIKIEVLGPISPHKNINNNSLVIKIIYKSVSFLFTGDAQKEEEDTILSKGYNLKSTVLKVGHHGSNTSSTINFLNKVRPRYAVISVGPDRSNLPKEKVIERINKFCKKVYRTDQNGNIIFLTNGRKVEVKTEK